MMTTTLYYQNINDSYYFLNPLTLWLSENNNYHLSTYEETMAISNYN